MSIEKIFGQVIQSFRRNQGLSQEQLAFESGYHRTYISLIERGQKSPSLNTIFCLAKSLNVKPSEILKLVETEISSHPHLTNIERKNKK